MVDTKDLKSFGRTGCGGSSPPPGTEKEMRVRVSAIAITNTLISFSSKLTCLPAGRLSHSHFFFFHIWLIIHKLALLRCYFIFNGANLKIKIMFDFQKLDVCQKSKNFCKEIYSTLDEKNFDRVTNDQLRRASFSIMLNIAEELHDSVTKTGKSSLLSREGVHLNVLPYWNIFMRRKKLEWRFSSKLRRNLKKSQKCYSD